MFKNACLAVTLGAFLVGCSWGDPTDDQLAEIADGKKAMLLRDEGTNRFLAVHLEGDSWTLHVINEP